MENIEFETTGMQGFSLESRFTSAIPNLIPTPHLEEIFPMKPDAALRLRQQLDQHRVHAEFPFGKDIFPRVENIQIGNWEDPAECKRIRQWLYNLGIPNHREVFASWDKETGLTTYYRHLVKYWDTFYNPPTDDLTVVGPSLSWAILFTNQGEIYFGSPEEELE